MKEVVTVSIQYEKTSLPSVSHPRIHTLPVESTVDFTFSSRPNFSTRYKKTTLRNNLEKEEAMNEMVNTRLLSPKVSQ